MYQWSLTGKIESEHFRSVFGTGGSGNPKGKRGFSILIAVACRKYNGEVTGREEGVAYTQEGAAWVGCVLVYDFLVLLEIFRCCLREIILLGALGWRLCVGKMNFVLDVSFTARVPRNWQ